MDTDHVAWKVRSWEELSTEELYRILVARQEVFIVEQQCPFLDCDGKDRRSFHLFGEVAEEVAAYCRLVPPGLSFQEPSIGRVLTTGSFRRGGYGRGLMTEALRQMARLYPNQGVRISAQQYLESFYASFGFVTCSGVYDEDGIPHVEMALRMPSSSRE